MTERQFHTSYFRPKRTAASLRASAERRKEKARNRQRRYRLGLAERRAPEIRDLAMLMLASWLVTAREGDPDTRRITDEFLGRLRQAGFSEAEAAERLKTLRKKVDADRHPSA